MFENKLIVLFRRNMVQSQLSQRKKKAISYHNEFKKEIKTLTLAANEV
jgi:hypothetical protein